MISHTSMSSLPRQTTQGGRSRSDTLYRGCSLDRIHGLSWTTDRKVAEGFVYGHRGMRVPDAVIAKTRIRKNDIITVVTDRGESEVIIDPDQYGFEASFQLYTPMQEAA